MKFILRLLITFLFRVKLKGLENLKMEDRAIIIPNHVSFLDGFFLYLYLPKEAVFVVNTNIARRFSFILRFVNHIDIDPFNPYSMKKIINVVKKDIPLVLFPEGRITTTKGLMKIYDGVGFVALKTGATLYPLAINGLEYCKFSRISTKVKTHWFPKVSLHCQPGLQLHPDPAIPMRVQKRQTSDKLQQILQETLFHSRFNPHTNLFTEVLEAGHLHGWRTRIATDITQEVSYHQLLLITYALAGKLKPLLKPTEQNVGVLLPNSIAHLGTLLGLCYLNRTPAILNFSSGTQNLLDCAETAQLKTILTSQEFIEKAGLSGLIDQLAPHFHIIYLEDLKATMGVRDKLMALGKTWCKARPQERASHQLILFTSGSESKPKGVVLNHRNILANIAQISSVIDFHGQDKILNALPMFHSFGLTAGIFLPILAGVPVFMYPSPLHFKMIPEISYNIKATIIFGTSTFLNGYGKHAHPYDFFSTRYVFAGAEKLKEDVRTLWQDKFGIRILEGYGCTETAPILSLNTPLSYQKGSVGRFLPGIEYQVQPVPGIPEGGNLLVKGPNVMEGYLLHKKGFVPAGEWYDCGDIVSIDAQKFVTIKSRLKRFAKISGEMVSLNLVEELAEKCFSTQHSYASICLSDPRKGERIVLVTTDKTAQLTMLRSFIYQNRFSMLLCPAQILYLDRLPLLGTGKVDYVSLQNMLR